MAAEETLRWSRHFSGTGCVAGGLGGLVGGTFVTVVLYAIFSISGWWVAGLLVVLVVLGALLGTHDSRREVHTAEFSRHGVRLVSPLTTRFVSVADLTAVTVDHSGDTDQGYVRTTLRLAIAGRPAETIPGVYDPALAGVLDELLGPDIDVHELHEDLEPPPSTA
ncbi:hypothetical protein [Actinophytocola sp.]|uniref:hypothetical protein n=1 Tax=Actinophytocola sp. TaxID=1872138 RepID=UPI002ED9395D